MNRPLQMANALLWATAIIASAILEASTALTIVLLPMLFVMSLLSSERRRQVPCRRE